MKFKTKLNWGLSLAVILVSIFLVFLVQMISQQTKNMHEVVTNLSDRMELASTAKYEMSNMGRELWEISSTPPEKFLQQSMNGWEQSKINLSSSLNTLAKMDNRQETQELVVKLQTLLKTYENLGDQLILLQKNGENPNFKKVLWGNLRQDRERMQQISDLLYSLQQQEMKDQLTQTRESYNLSINIIYIFIIISFVIGIGMSLWMIRGLTINLNRVAEGVKDVSFQHGVTRFPRIEVTSKDEIGSIAIAVNGMVDALEKHSIQEKELLEKTEQHAWLKSKVAEITSIYTAVEDLKTLASLFITKITPMVGAQYGAFYMKEGQGEQQRLKNMSSYAYSHDYVPYESFRFGEGLVGQCALENKPLLLSKIPENVIQVAAATGMVQPKNIYILPAEFEGEVMAVLEVASFEPFTTLQQELLHEVMDHIGITLHSIANRMQLKKLLQDSQTLTEELQSQSEELQLQQEELRTINEELEEQYKSSEERKKELEKITRLLEEKAQQLAQTSQYKTEFLANVSHELRTPLNSMLILAQMLIEKKNENLTAKQLEYIRTIHSSGKDLLQLINEILDLARVEAGKIEIIQEDVFFARISLFVERQFAPLAKQKGIEFQVHVDKNVPDSIYSDEHRINQILKNLLSNAFKFTEKGSISLIIHHVVKNESEQEPMVSFTVRDTGIGIPKDKQKLIFEAFTQADGTTSRKYGGTGLGLSISQELASVLGGFIEVKSEEGVGSSFTLFLPYRRPFEPEQKLPIAKEAAAGLAEDAIDENSGSEWTELSSELNEVTADYPWESSLISGKKILIVDDDMRNIFALSAALEEYDIEVLFAENGREGIEILQENPDVDLILMDIMMPEMDGFEAMRVIRSKSEYQELPIIALTAKAMKQNRDECLKAGASDYISKPIDLTQLYSLIQVWLYR